MIARHRAYRSGTTWCWWRWTEVDSEYLVRLHILKTPWFAVCLHWIKRADAEPFLHDHPVTFLSIILRGWYSEYRLRRERLGPLLTRVTEGIRAHRWLNFIRASRDDRHRIGACDPRTLTLTLMGPVRQKWGFYLPRGWVFWKDYYARQRRMSHPEFETWVFTGVEATGWEERETVSDPAHQS